MLVRSCLLTLLLITACSSDTNQVVSPEQTSEPEQTLLNDPVEDAPVEGGLISTDSGLEYQVLRKAEGDNPTEDSIVTVHYHGTLLDGTEFDSSYSRGEPATFALARTIKGWVEGVQLMTVGSKFRFVIPPHLAYGDRGTGTLIKPGDTLIFVVELLEINSN